MRIISSFKDYYDCIQKYGYSPDPTYIRETITEEMNYASIAKTLSIGGLTFDLSVIGFCGEVYPVVTSYTYVKTNLNYAPAPILHRYFKLNDVLDYLKSKLSYKEYVRIENNPKWNVESLHIFYSFFKDGELDLYKKYFEKKRCPIFYITRGSPRKSTLILNCNLSQLEFQRVFDPYRAFQEIERYLGNMAFPNPTIPEVSDKDMIIAKGFDKYSFRKSKSK